MSSSAAFDRDGPGDTAVVHLAFLVLVDVFRIKESAIVGCTLQ